MKEGKLRKEKREINQKRSDRKYWKKEIVKIRRREINQSFFSFF